MDWDPNQYLAFADLRLRPALDLMARVPLARPATIVDLGCGTGAATVPLKRRWPAARVAGVDSSADMLAKGRAVAADIDWVAAEIGAWRAAAPVDLLYSNAALHWLPDHGRLFPHLLDQVAPGGALAVQMPRMFRQPSHTLIEDVAREGPWAGRLAGLIKPPPVAEPAVYYALLAPRVARLDLWETEYQQVLEGEAQVADWTKGTWLKPFLDALAEPERSAFETEYRRRTRLAYPPLADGRTLFPFRRLFIVATKG
ncbi:MAG: methyltransferase domain-containing protein [Alphaproteobacteria bacterium]|nr:methyltransferase domain-containing protein [Alphaproteobacteria bacterium]